jgi:uncharacterized OB-fold protein
MSDGVTVGIPRPTPDALSAFFWEGCRAGVLQIQRCTSCGTFIHYPRPVCKNCLGTNLEPSTVSGHGSVYSFTVAHQAFHPWFADKIPFVIATIELVEQPHLHLISNVVDCSPYEVEVGMQVSVVFREVEPGLVLPLFKRREL